MSRWPKERLRLAEQQRDLATAAAASAKRTFEAGVASSLEVLERTTSCIRPMWPWPTRAAGWALRVWHWTGPGADALMTESSSADSPRALAPIRAVRLRGDRARGTVATLRRIAWARVAVLPVLVGLVMCCWPPTRRPGGAGCWARSSCWRRRSSWWKPGATEEKASAANDSHQPDLRRARAGCRHLCHRRSGQPGFCLISSPSPWWWPSPCGRRWLPSRRLPDCRPVGHGPGRGRGAGANLNLVVFGGGSRAGWSDTHLLVNAAFASAGLLLIVASAESLAVPSTP